MLNMTDRRILVDSSSCLTDRHISAAQRLIKRTSPNVAGLRDSTVLHIPRTECSQLGPNEVFVQIHNVNRNHWVVSTYNHETRTVTVSVYAHSDV